MIGNRSWLVLPWLLMALSGPPALAISNRTILTATGAVANDRLGNSVASAGDFNGDGFDDVIAGSYLNGATNAGQAYIYYGGGGADVIPDLTLTGLAANDEFGYSVSPAGDVNGDGVDDVIVAAPFSDAGGVDAGRAYVFFGGLGADSIADLTLTGAAAGDEFGTAVASAGDMNGDGYADVIVGAIRNDLGGALTDAGRAYVYYGGPGADAVPDLTFSGTGAGDFLGISVATAGDVNADGFADVIVGAFLNDFAAANAGQAYVFHGGPGADAAPDFSVNGTFASDFFGYSVASAGDMNGDGYSDVIIGAYGFSSTNDGRAYVYYRGPGTDAQPDLTLTGVFPGDEFGISVATAGDVNGDGFGDVIVGAHFGGPGSPEPGQATVFFGGLAADIVPDITWTGVASADEFGISVAGAGDVDGDGFGDVVVGAYRNDSGVPDVGQVYVNLIYPYQVLAPNGAETLVAGRPCNVRWLGHDVADLACSFDGGATWSQVAASIGGNPDNEHQMILPAVQTDAALVRLSYSGQDVAHSTSDVSDRVFRIVRAETPPAAASRLAASPVGAAANDNFGRWVASAGDLNGDGFADWMVSAPMNDAGGADAGAVYVYFGPTAAVNTVDLTLLGQAAGDLFGFVSAAAVGDLNGDGFSDLAVGARQNDAGGVDAGRVYVYFGGVAPNPIADLTLTGEAPGDHFGNAVGAAGDVNGDGYADLLVGAPRNDAGGSNAGRLYVFFGANGPPDPVADWVLTGAAATDLFGYAVAAGDVNGDDFSDVVIGAPQNDAAGTDAGRVYVYHGGPSANSVPDRTLTGEAAGDLFGLSVGAAGGVIPDFNPGEINPACHSDWNGDGFADVIVGAPNNRAGGDFAGRVYIYAGGIAGGVNPEFVATGVGGGQAGQLGFSVAAAGDVNGDCFGDLIAGAASSDAGGIAAGRAYVYHGGPGVDAIPDLTLTGDAANDGLGVAVAGVGDVNADGFPDVLAGAFTNDANGPDAGRAYLHDFKRYFVTTPNGGEIWNVGATQTIAWEGEEPAQVWLSVDGGLTYDPLAVGVWPDNRLILRVPHTPTRYARVKVTPIRSDVRGGDECDTLFTMQSSVTLLGFAGQPGEGEGEFHLEWATEPAVGPDGIAGYRLYRLPPGGEGQGTRIGPDLIAETSYTDQAGGAGCVYRLSAVNGLGEELVMGEVASLPAVPLAAWPLPYRGGDLSVTFATAGGLGGGTAPAEVRIYDVSGRLIRTLVRGPHAAGSHSTVWNGRDDQGGSVPSGVYFLRSTSTGHVKQLKLVVIR